MPKETEFKLNPKGFVRLGNDKIMSKAYQSLNKAGQSVYTALLTQARWKTENNGESKIINNGKIALTYRQAKDLGLGSTTFNRGLRELHAVGLIDVEAHGGYHGSQPTRYRFSDRWRDYGKANFSECNWEQRNPQGVGNPKGVRPGESRSNPKAGMSKRMHL